MNEITVYDNLIEIKEKADKVFDLLDVMEETRADYKYRIGLFLDFVSEKGFNRNIFLEYKNQRNNHFIIRRHTARKTGCRIPKYLETPRKIASEVNLKSINR